MEKLFSGGYTERQRNLPLRITGCIQPHKEICRFAAAAGAILTADFICREYNAIGITKGRKVIPDVIQIIIR